MNRYLVSMLAAVAMGLSSLAHASFVIEQKTDAVQDKAAPVEVVEFFSYGCVHCNALQPALADWEQTNKRMVRVKHVPVSFGRPMWDCLARTYIALTDTGLWTPKLDASIFKAIHEERTMIDSMGMVKDLLARQGVSKSDLERFSAAYQDKKMDRRLKEADTLAQKSGMTGVPAITVNGVLLPGGSPDMIIGQLDTAVKAARSAK
jgi:thiol:disulfide interchange protein DsbA